MSDDWVEDRLVDAVGRKTAADISKAGYDKWLMVVDESGTVVDIAKLDSNANAIGKIPI
jgi:glycosyltransferase A (GT-A) superfamily protein (DUF2064 family)